MLGGMRLPKSGRFYGGGGTIHGTGCVNVETRNGRVVGVWFRCQPLPWDQTAVNEERERSMADMKLPVLDGVIVIDQE